MAIVPRKPNVNPSENVVKSRSKVPFSYHNTGTFRFGHYSPHFVMEGVNGDKINRRIYSDTGGTTITLSNRYPCICAICLITHTNCSLRRATSHQTDHRQTQDQ